MFAQHFMTLVLKSSLRTRVGSMGMIPRLNNSHNGRAQDPQDRRRRGRVAVWPRACSSCFLTFEGLCTMNLPPKARPWMLGSTAMFFAIWGEDIRWKWPELWCADNWLLHDDNAPSHQALVMREFLAQHSIITLPYPPYSPDLAPCDFFLFPKMNLQVKGRYFDRVEEIQWESQYFLGTLWERDFQHIFQQWQRRWDRCVAAQGDYFEVVAAQT